MQGQPIIQLNKASVRYGDSFVLDRLDWQVFSGQHWAVTGHNGAGKSTLLKLLRADTRPFTDFSQSQNSPAAISWNFEGYPNASPLAVRPHAAILSAELQRHYVRQGWQLSGEDVILSGFGDGYMLYDRPSAEEKTAAYAVAARLGALHLLDALAPELSQGQLRLLLLARALVKRPRLLLLDEPCDGLDKAAQKTFFSILDEIAAETCIVCAIHKGEDIPACLTHVLELEKGRIIKKGLLDTGKLAGGQVQNTAPPSARRGYPPGGVPVFSFNNADVYLKRKKILHQIDWQVKEGEQWLLSGPNGSGKSTLLRVLLGEEHVALGGALCWFGLEHPPTLEERQRYTGYVSDWLRNSYGYNLCGRELVLSGLHNSYGLYREPTQDELAQAEYWIKLLGLDDMAETPLDKMSEGISRRFLLARALAPQPKLLILDEPCSGLDASAREQFMRHLPLALEHGAQVIFVSHSNSDLANIKHLLTHELALDKGKITYSGPVR